MADRFQWYLATAFGPLRQPVAYMTVAATRLPRGRDWPATREGLTARINHCIGEYNRLGDPDAAAFFVFQQEDQSDGASSVVIRGRRASFAEFNDRTMAVFRPVSTEVDVSRPVALAIGERISLPAVSSADPRNKILVYSSAWADHPMFYDARGNLDAGVGPLGPARAEFSHLFLDVPIDHWRPGLYSPGLSPRTRRWDVATDADHKIMLRYVDALCLDAASREYNDDLSRCAFIIPAREMIERAGTTRAGIMSFRGGGFHEYGACRRRAALDFKLASVKCQKEMDD